MDGRYVSFTFLTCLSRCVHSAPLTLLFFFLHTVHRSGSDILDELESWKIETSNLTFLVGTACDQDWGPTAGIMSLLNT
jgi:hypothetical protein